MNLLLDNNAKFEIELEQNTIADTIKKIFKHLQHVPIPFKTWDNPFLLDNQTHKTLVQDLKLFAQRLKIDVDVELCYSQDQSYFNYLHKIYEKSYNGDPKWLDYHEHIHLCEKHEDDSFKRLVIDYREKSGPLEQRFNLSFREFFKNEVNPGEVYLSWAELGKTPYGYWENREPDDINRICELAKPWLILRPKLSIAFSNKNFLINKKIDNFNHWWKQYHDQWCHHWNIDHWSIEDMFSVSKIGYIDDLDRLKNSLFQGHNPSWIKM